MTDHRRCESCGGAMPGRMARERDSKGRLVCPSCKTSGIDGGWNMAYAAAALTEAQLAEHQRREAESLAAISRLADMSKVAHDSGDGATIFHCPFCGSGAVVGGADGTVTCDYCHNAFTVQVQPKFKNMPQTVNGQPFNIPGMPGGGPDAGATAETEQGQQDAAQDGTGAPPDPTAPAPSDPTAPATKPGNLPFKGSALLTDDGVVLDTESYQRRLALAFADDRESVLAQVRSEHAGG